MLKSASSH